MYLYEIAQIDIVDFHPVFLAFLRQNSDDVGLLWRLARANYELQKSLSSDSAKLEALQGTFSVVERALTIDSEDPNAHKWVAIYMNAITKIQGSKAQIEKGQAIKEHMLVSFLLRTCLLVKVTGE